MSHGVSQEIGTFFAIIITKTEFWLISLNQKRMTSKTKTLFPDYECERGHDSLNVSKLN